MALRLGVVAYLNCLPLFRSLQEESDVEIIERVPAELTKLLESQLVDAALLPLFEYYRGVGAALVPGLSIASDGPVASVMLFLTRPIGECRSIAVDRGSRSSVALLKILLAERFGGTANLTARRAELEVMLASFDAALLIGDAALQALKGGKYREVLDLGEVWTRWTGLPFVYAAWTTRSGLKSTEFLELTTRLQEARMRGYAMLDTIAQEQTGRGGLDHAGIKRYLTENIRTEFDDRFQRGAAEFSRLCVRHGLLTNPRPLRFAVD